MDLKALAELPNYVQIVEAAAQAAHEANREYCLTIGDTSHKPWADAPQWQRDSAINGVLGLIGNPERTPEQSHEAWMKEKVNEGWIYGKQKNAKAKTHPCIVAYADLPEPQRKKDVLFNDTVKAFLVAAMPALPTAKPEQGVSPHLDAPGALAHPNAGEPPAEKAAAVEVPAELDEYQAACAAGKPKVALVGKYSDRTPVQLKSAAHLAELKDMHTIVEVVEVQS